LKNRLAYSSLKTTFFLGLRILTQGTLLVLLTRLLGPSVYGDFSAATALAMIVGVLPTFGAGFTMLAREAGAPDGARLVWRYAWPMTLFLGLILIPAYIYAAGLITASALSVRILLPVGVSELVLTPVTYLASYSLLACDMVPLSQFTQWLPLALRITALLPCFLLPDTHRLSAYVAFQLITSLLGCSFALIIAHRLGRLDWRPTLAKPRELRVGAAYAAMQLVAANPSELDKIIAVRSVGAHDAGIYATASRVMASAITPVIGMLLATQPRMFRHTQHPTHAGRRLILTVAWLSLGWGALSGLLLALSSPLLPLLFGAPYAATAQLMVWLAPVAPLLSLRLAAGSMLMAFGKPLERIAFEMIGMLILVASMLLLAPHYRTQGLAIALIIAEASMASIGWLLVRRRMSERDADLATSSH
jgi:O-antigen/teichoic acid export membrane protein